ncbi:MAG: hypothetical protein Q9191_005339 [Dirinaria sp. TL-2023a]
MAVQPAIVAARLQEILDYQFSDPINACSALVASQMASWQHFGPRDRSGITKEHREGNKKLALLGDAALRFVLVEREWDHDSYRGVDSFVQGFIQQNISSALSNRNLNTVGRKSGIYDLVITEPSLWGHVSDGMVATAVEATIGAVYIDSDRDMNAVKKVMRKLELL